MEKNMQRNNLLWSTKTLNINVVEIPNSIKGMKEPIGAFSK